MRKHKKQILVLTMISVFMATVLFFPGLAGAGNKNKKPKPHEAIITMLDEIYDIVLDTNSKVTPATCMGAPVEKTGQTESYSTGDDGNLEKGVAWPDPRFTDNSNGTVTDNLTGLIWLKNANCNGAKTWANALAFANSLYDGWTGDGGGGDCGLTDNSNAGDWRLANFKELGSLLDLGQFGPALSFGHPFVGITDEVANRFWSSTTYAPRTSEAWYIEMYNGVTDAFDKATSALIWPVRDGN